ncbi:hypothetical protein N431DRAFT_436498 [Stipitochalara longipes BDJ]|nr:hypothetical protein N431DRAFT_436498 [Stipitochalara longipes BDJ]
MAIIGFLILVFAFLLSSSSVVADPDNIVDTQDWVALPIADVDGFFPTAWECGGVTPNPQNMLDFHYNWHCTNQDDSTSVLNWGNRFFGFHKQFIHGYNNFLAARGEPNVKTWIPGPNVPIPPEHRGRASNTPCAQCLALSPEYLLPPAGTLNTFTSTNSLGMSIVNWHNSNHGNIAAAGGTGDCPGPDMNCKNHSPNDPIFYRYHHIFDDVQDAWATYQPTDIAIVFDRSGSMSLPVTGGGDRLDAAKTAADLFANLLETGSNHKLGMVSFSTSASNPPDMPLTDVSGAPSALSAALSSIVPSGSTSIGDGLEKAQALISSGPEARKAILLLTDGMENTAPFISDAESVLPDSTHICSIGLGTPGTLDGPRLQDLSEAYGGIYMSTTTSLELKKFFVFCFANLFDTFAAEDPIDTLPASKLVSSPTVHGSSQDQKIVFVLGWTHPMPRGTLQLAITTPSGNVVNLNDASIESKFGPTWHIVRIKLPYNSEQDGNWTARAIRPVYGYVNGFSSRSFEDFEQGVALVQNELANLCANECRNVLYYEDPANFTSFVDSNSIYAQALNRESGQNVIGNITRPGSASEFALLLQNGFGEGGFDLLVYSSQFTAVDQPYDNILAEVLCSNKTSNIISDNRHTQGAQNILRCAGAQRGRGTNFSTLTATNSQLLDQPAKLRGANQVLDFSYELLLENGAEVQATTDSQTIGVLAHGLPGQDEEFFITVLTSSTTKVKPFKFQNNTYTLEPLHPTFHIPGMYWPTCGYDNVTAYVNVTKPVTSLSHLLASVGTTKGSTIQGDGLTASQAAGQALAAQNIPIPTESQIFPLYDDGTHGDSTANDHYWEVDLPPDFTAVDGDYQMHAFFRLCQRDCCGGPEKCINREAQQSITIRALLCASHTTINVTNLSDCNPNRLQARILITPADSNGTLLGPGLIGELIITPVGSVKIESAADEDGKGTYAIVVDFVKGGSPAPAVQVAQFGRPGSAITISL